MIIKRVKTPDGKLVLSADAHVIFNGCDNPDPVTIIIDDHLSDNGVDIDNDAWSEFDEGVFYYASTEEWELLNRGELLVDFKLVVEGK